MCDIFEVRTSSYFLWQKAGPSDRWKKNEALLNAILDVFETSKGSYGSPRMTKELRAQGKNASRPLVARLMKAAGIQARRRKKFIVTTDSKHNYPIASNVLDRKFSATRPGEVWVSDITYVRTYKGWLYLTVIIDLFDRKVVGWDLSKGLTAAETILAAWFMAITNRPVTEALIFHSDRGVQYACDDFTRILKSNKLITRSMSRKGNCWDNAVAESFFKSIKVEWIYSNSYENQEQAALSIFEWIESWYNRRRRHSALGYKTIEEFYKINSNFKHAA
jgi:putative transposase